MNKKTILSVLGNIFIGVCLVACTVLFVFKVCFVKVVVNGSSMNPTIDNGSKGFMIKASNDKGYIIIDTRGIKTIFIIGLKRFISKKLFISMGIDARNAI